MRRAGLKVIVALMVDLALLSLGWTLPAPRFTTATCRSPLTRTEYKPGDFVLGHIDSCLGVSAAFDIRAWLAGPQAYPISARALPERSAGCRTAWEALGTIPLDAGPGRYSVQGTTEGRIPLGATFTSGWSTQSFMVLPQLLIGLGPTAQAALRSRLARETSVKLFTTWYNGPQDVGWVRELGRRDVPGLYREGKSLHLVVFSDDEEMLFPTKYGLACGRPYPLSDGFLDDMAELAQVLNGPRLYVTLFTEFQTYPCFDNAWNPDPSNNAYLRALKDRYFETLELFHRAAPGSKVSLGWVAGSCAGMTPRWAQADRCFPISPTRCGPAIFKASKPCSRTATSTTCGIWCRRWVYMGR